MNAKERELLLGKRDLQSERSPIAQMRSSVPGIATIAEIAKESKLKKPVSIACSISAMFGNFGIRGN